MPLIVGAHMSTQGGVWRGVERAREVGCDCVQIFSKNNNQWNAKPFQKEDIEKFESAIKTLEIARPIAHASYLINLAAPAAELWNKSIDAMIDELHRAEQLHLEGVVMHPGSYTTSSPDEGIAKIIEAIKMIFARTPKLKTKLLLENTAGQGSNLGADLKDLGRIVEAIGRPERLSVCIDSCHAMAAGYDLAEASGLKELLRDIDDNFGIERVVAIHLNDSKKGCGSRVDRHEHIGQGTIGSEGFKRFLHNRSLRAIPMYLETPKGNDETTGEDLDVMNLRVVRELGKK
jgi:deoxyribonuclease-4